MDKFAIIVAGGKGNRMGNKTPKQFLPLKGKPILIHTIEKFISTFQDIKIILVLPENQIDCWEELCFKHKFPLNSHLIVVGGETRFHSVKNALALVGKDDLVGIHDGVRPLVNEQTIQLCYQTAEQKGTAIPVIDVVDSLRFVSKKDESNKSVIRSLYKSVQTPQCFQSNIILNAYQQDFENSFTDDASVVEKLGVKINLVEGNKENIKITTQQDLIIANALLKLYF